jgi:dihydrofolate synthase/folylpolyglutamate synthase
MSECAEKLRATLDYLSGRQDLGNDGHWSIGRMLRLLEAGAVPRNGPFIQVAGTNGKGSTCAFLQCGLCALGLRTGLYTSPHLINWNERIKLNGNDIADEIFLQLLLRWIEIADGLGEDIPPTCFEILTAAALDFFRRESVDVAILEVGLGGRCDATSAVFAEICAITTIGLDHVDVLGRDIKSIAREKAAIARPGVPLVVGNVQDEAMEVIGAAARCAAAPIVSPRQIPVPPLAHMVGVEQEENYRTAAEIGSKWLNLHGMGGDEIRDKFLGAMAEAVWPGRWHWREISGLRWIFDCTHNVHGLTVLRKNWQRIPEEERRSPTVVTCTLGKDRARDLLPFLSSIAKNLVLVELNDRRALNEAELRSFVPEENRSKISCLAEAQLTKELPKLTGDPILVVGSILLVGKALAAFS